MPSRDWRLRVEDILESIAAIQSYVGDYDQAAFAADQRTVDAVVRRFTIIGEAASHVPAEIVTAHSAIPWNKMREMRNVVVHGYFGVDTRILWETIQSDLPPLVPLLESLLRTS